MSAASLRATLIALLAAAASGDAQLEMFAPLELAVPLPGGAPPTPSFNVTSTWVELLAPGASTPTRHAVFFTQPFTRALAANGSEVLEPAGAPRYAVRLACAVLGRHAYAQRAAPGAALPPDAIAGAFECTAPARADGWAAVDAAHGQYFVLRNVSGTAASAPLWLVGENMAWPGVWPYFNGSAQFSNGTGGTYMYDRMLPRLAAVSGGNYIRLWACPALVREPTYDGEQGSFLALGLGALVPYGSYNLEAAWRIDYIVELCRALGIKINFVLVTTQEMCDDGGTWCFWDDATWNAANGGPLPNASALWTSPAARAELEQRWRYVAARWAYSTSIFAWELANENDGAAGWGDAAADLQLALASVVAEADPYGHLVSNSFLGYSDRGAAVLRMENDARIAFTAAHGYGDGDFAAAVWGMVTPRVAAHGKPAFLQEFGASWKGPLQHVLDPTGLGVHNAAWASAVGLGAGTGMQWWWNEMDALNTYGNLQGAATFVREAVGARLLNYRWAQWKNASSSGCAGANAGYTVGSDAEGIVRAVSFFVYNRNNTWAAQNKSAALRPIPSCVTTLHNVPLPAGAAPGVTWFDTATGKPRAAERLLAAAGDVVFAAPAFTTDAAALALAEG